MAEFTTKRLPSDCDTIAPDGSCVRVLLALSGGSAAHFRIAGAETSIAVSHRPVEEISFFLGGRGEMWRKQGSREEIVPVEAGVTLTIPVGTHFQFRSFGTDPLTAVAVTMPPWPGDDEAVVVAGIWTPTLPHASSQP